MPFSFQRGELDSLLVHQPVAEIHAAYNSIYEWTVLTEEPNAPFLFSHARSQGFNQSDSSNCSAGETEPMLELLERKGGTLSVVIELKFVMPGLLI